TVRATVDLPQPLSPTSEKVSPRRIAKLRPSTAVSTYRGIRITSRVTSGLETPKFIFRSRTSRSGASDTAGSDIGEPSVIEPAGRELAARLGRGKRRRLFPADRPNLAAARIEGAAFGAAIEPRHGAFDIGEILEVLADLRDRIHQPAGVGMLRIVDHAPHLADLDKPPQIDLRDAIGGFRDDPHVMRHQHGRD